jgi:FNIP Repeat
MSSSVERTDMNECKDDAYSSFVDTITPIISLLLQYLSDKAAIDFLCTNQYFYHLLTSYAVKSRIRVIGCNANNTVLVDSKYRDVRHTFPVSLLGRIQHLIGNYRSIHKLLLILGNEGRSNNNCLLKHVTFSCLLQDILSYDFINCARKCLTSLPPSLLSLNCAGTCRYDDQQFFPIHSLSDLCPNLQHLVLPSNFSESEAIFVGDLPDTLRTLIFTCIIVPLNSDYCPSFLPGVFPKSLLTLELSCYQGEIVKGVFPDTLQYLNTGCLFNRSLHTLPSSLIKLELWGRFNQVIPDGVLPSTLRILRFSVSFNHVLPQLPPSLEELRLGCNFNQIILPGVLPPSLKRIFFGQNFNQPLDEKNVPLFLKCLVFDSDSLFQHPLHVVVSLSRLTCLCLPRDYPIRGLTKDDVPNLLESTLISHVLRTVCDCHKGAVPAPFQPPHQALTFSLRFG